MADVYKFRRRETEGDRRRKEAIEKGLKPIGFQLGNKDGQIIQGGPLDPTGLAAHEVLSPVAATMVVMQKNVHLVPVYEGEIENGVLIGADELVWGMKLHKF